LENQQGIVWVVGRRLSEAVKMVPSTRRIIEMEARPLGTKNRTRRSKKAL
jgi:hypothetical protein